MTISELDTSIEPPGLDADEDDEGTPTILLSAWMSEVDGTRRSSTMMVDADATDDELAAGLVACLRGCATMRSPGLMAAVERRLR